MNPLAGLKVFGVDVEYLVNKFVRDTLAIFVGSEVVINAVNTDAPNFSLEALGASIVASAGIAGYRVIRDLYGSFAPKGA